MKFVVQHARVARLLGVIVTSIALSACGGGGGGGGGEASSNPSPAPAASNATRVTSSNAGNFAGYGMGLTELTLQLAHLSADFLQLVAGNLTAAPARTCQNGGVATTSFNDANGDGRVNAGDSLSISFRDCYLRAVNAIVGGSLDISLEALPGNFAGADEAYAATIAFGPTFGSDGISFEGGFKLEWMRDSIQTLLRVAPNTQDRFRLVRADAQGRYVESISAPRLTKAIRYDQARIRMSSALTVDSQLIGTRVTISTPDEFLSYFNTYPDQGRLRLTASDGSRVDIGGNIIRDGSVPLLLDTNGDNTPENVFNPAWTSLIEGFLWWDPLTGARPLPGAGQTFVPPADLFTVYPVSFLTSFSVAYMGPRSALPPGFWVPGTMPQAFGVVPGATSDPQSPNVRVVLQFSRELMVSTLPAYEFVGANSTSMPTVVANVPADVVVNGARVTFTPRTPLEFGANYILQPITPPPQTQRPSIREAQGTLDASAPSLALSIRSSLPIGSQ